MVSLGSDHSVDASLGVYLHSSRHSIEKASLEIRPRGLCYIITRCDTALMHPSTIDYNLWGPRDIIYVATKTRDRFWCSQPSTTSYEQREGSETRMGCCRARTVRLLSTIVTRTTVMCITPRPFLPQSSFCFLVVNFPFLKSQQG